MNSIFSYDNNSTQKLDKLVLSIQLGNFIFSFLFGFFTNIENNFIFRISDALVFLVILGRFLFDSKFKFIYFLIYSLIIIPLIFLLSEITIQFFYKDLWISIFLYFLFFFFNAYIFQYCKLKSYKKFNNNLA